MYNQPLFQVYSIVNNNVSSFEPEELTYIHALSEVARFVPRTDLVIEK